MRARVYFLSLSLLLSAGFGICTTSLAQEQDQVIVKGNPPLTVPLAGKLVTLLQWSLDLRFSDEQRVKILQALIREWEANNRAEINNVLEVAKLVDSLSKAAEADRIKAKEIIREGILKGLQNEPNDEINRVIIQAYEAAHSASLKTAPPAN